MDLPTALSEPQVVQQQTPSVPALSTETPVPGQPGNTDNRFQAAISAWRNIDLSKLVPELDVTATDVVAHQKEALVSRKDLAQKTKDFRKLDDSAKLTEIKTLLKSYQTFIDVLTNHGKTAQSAFLQVYSSISEAPDPYPLLEASVDSLLLSEDTLPKLSAENDHLQKSVTKLTDQLNLSEKQLTQERSVRTQLEKSRDSKIKEVEASWRAVIDEKTDNWASKEKSFEEKVENQDRLLTDLKANYEVAQRLGQGEEVGEPRQTASAAELEIVSSDLDRTTQRLADVEARNEQLRTQLAEASSQTHKVTEEDPANEQLRNENLSLLRRIDAAALKKDADMLQVEAQKKAIEKDLRSAESDRDALRAKVHSWRNYSEIKQELDIFKSIEFSTLDDEEADSAPSQQTNGVPKDGKESLEKMLLARNKKLGDEMAVLRVSHQGLQEQLGSLQELLKKTTAELEEEKNLSATLESDLSKVQQEATNTFPSNMSSAGTYTSRYNTNSFRNKNRASSPTSSIISGFDPASSSRSTLDAIRAGEPVGGGSGILPMITAQRDRFKQKNAQLETDLQSQYNTVTSLRQEIASLQRDNLSLYEKTRYISTYNRGGPSTSSSTYASSPAHTTSVSDNATERYKGTYEASLSPFAAFRGRESTRAYKRLSLPERVVFSLTRMVLANRTSRNVFAFYCLALHLMIFVTLYWMQGADSVKNAGSLSTAAAGAAGAGVKKAADVVAGGRGWQQEGFIADPNEDS